MTTASAPILRFSVGDTVVPGDRLGNLRHVVAGPGTRVVGTGHIYASLVGTLCLDPIVIAESSSSVPNKSPAAQRFQCRVDSKNKALAQSHALRVGQLVMGRISRITPQNAILEINLVEGLGAPSTLLEGAIRMEDVKAGTSATLSADAQQASIADNFQPKDIVVGRILSVGDSRRYFLSTAETELGVLQATCRVCPDNRSVMVPISWKEMECPTCQTKALRKCAKPGGGLKSILESASA